MGSSRVLALSTSANDVIFASTGIEEAPGGPHYFHRLAVSNFVDESVLARVHLSWATSADPARVSIYPDEDRAEIIPGSRLDLPSDVKTDPPDGLVISLVDASEFAFEDHLPFLMSTPRVFVDVNALSRVPSALPSELVAAHSGLTLKGTETEMAGIERYLSDNGSNASIVTTYGADGFEYVAPSGDRQVFPATDLGDSPPWFARGAGDVLLMTFACALVAGLDTLVALEHGRAAAEALIRSRLQ